jgi:putative membrane protein
VIGAIGFHHVNLALLKKFEASANRRSHRWFRWYNEISVLLFTAIVALVVFKPF